MMGVVTLMALVLGVQTRGYSAHLLGRCILIPGFASLSLLRALAQRLLEGHMERRGK